MKTTRTFRPSWVAFGLLVATCGHAQVTTPSNSPFFGDYVGCDGGTTFPLEVRHNGNYPIEWYTDSLQRMRLTETLTSQTVNGYTGLDLSGHLGVGQFAAPVFTPLAMLHLDSAGTQVTGYRPWMGTGTLMTKLSDMMYVGLKTESPDRIDAVVSWADNIAGDSSNGPDRLRFIFTRRPQTPANQVVETYDGLEIARMIPDTTGNEGFLGVGDWNTAGVEPDERLDVLDRTVRIRRMVPDYRSDTLSRVLMTDVNGRVHWRAISTWPQTPGGATCDWDLYSAAPKMVTAWRPPGTNGNCPDRRWLTGIGKVSPSAKLHVEHNATELAADAGLKVGYTANSGTMGDCYGIQSSVTPSGGTVPNSFGTHSKVTDPGVNGTAVFGRVGAGSAVTGANSATGCTGEVRMNSGAVIASPTGLRGLVDMQSGSSATTVIGSHATADILNASGTLSDVYGALNEAKVTSGTLTNLHGMKSEAKGGTGTITNSFGAWTMSSASGSSMQNSTGLFATGKSGTAFNYGVQAIGQGNTSNSWNFGIHAQVFNGTGQNAVNWAGYFQGKVHIAGAASCTSSSWTSDATLKTDVEDLSGARELLAQLRPKNYRFRTDELPHAGLPAGLQHGLIAQELEETMPELVTEMHLSAVLNEEGEEVQAAMPIKGVNYIGLIPVLIGAAQEQQAQLDAQQAQQDQQQQVLDELRALVDEQRTELARVQELLAACCNNPDAGRALQQGLFDPEGSMADPKLHIQPNPFNERTTVYYRVEQAGRAQLLANSADGKELRVLHEANLEPGSYQHEWNTADLAPGMYYVTLLLNGQPVVKKAVKVDR